MLIIPTPFNKSVKIGTEFRLKNVKNWHRVLIQIRKNWHRDYFLLPKKTIYTFGLKQKKPWVHTTRLLYATPTGFGFRKLNKTKS